MRRIIAQTRKELTQIMRDRLALALALVLPLGLLLLLGTAISLTVNDLPIVVQDLDDSPASLTTDSNRKSAGRMMINVTSVVDSKAARLGRRISSWTRA